MGETPSPCVPRVSTRRPVRRILGPDPPAGGRVGPTGEESPRGPIRRPSGGEWPVRGRLGKSTAHCGVIDDVRCTRSSRSPASSPLFARAGPTPRGAGPARGASPAAVQVLGVEVATLGLEVGLLLLGVGDAVRAAEVQVLRARLVPFNVLVAAAGLPSQSLAAATVARVNTMRRSMSVPLERRNYCRAARTLTDSRPHAKAPRLTGAVMHPSRALVES